MNQSEQIRSARERLGMTQEVLAEQLDVSRQAVSKWEMGTASPSLENLKALSQVLGVELTPEPEKTPVSSKNPWKVLSLVLGCLLLASLLVLGSAAFSRETPGETFDLLQVTMMEQSKPQNSTQENPFVTGTAFFSTDGAPLRPDLGDGWLSFTPGSRILMAVSYQDGVEACVHAVSLFLTPTGTETFNERQQLAVQAVEMNRGIALFLLDIPQDLMGHLDITLECDGGQTITETLNVTALSP